jgi:electron transfer flavoprotein alpha subunit
MLHLKEDRCIGCGICEEKCAFNMIQMDGGLPAIKDGCVLCGSCVAECPEQALVIEEDNLEKRDVSGYHGFWVVSETENSGRLLKVSLELLSEAKKLAGQKNEKTIAVVLNQEIPVSWETDIASTGCEEILQLDVDGCRYNAELFTEAIAQAVLDKRPEVILFPATVNGRDLAPRVACRLETGLTADCTGLDLDDKGNLVQIRPTYGGSIMASIVTPHHRPQMASVRPNVFKVVKGKAPLGGVRVEKLEIQPHIRPDRTRWIERLEKELSFMDVSEAKVLVAGGYGMGSQDNFKLIYKLSSYLNAAAGATRKAVDEGWAPAEIQVGQTGKTVAPEVYIACGISGALQHTLGIKHSKKIIAINNDPAAPIFSISDVAILGDVVDVLNELCKLIEDRKEQTLQ